MKKYLLIFIFIAVLFGTVGFTAGKYINTSGKVYTPENGNIV